MTVPAQGTGSEEGTGQTEGQDGQDQDPQGQDQGQDGTEDDFDSLPEPTKAEIRKLRRDNQRLRKAARGSKGQEDAPAPTGQAALLAKLAEAFGIDMGAGTTQDPPKAPAKDDSSANELRLAKVELAVYRVAGAAGADPDALLDSRSFLREIEDLDPTDSSFEKDIRDAAKAALGQNPSLRVKDGTGQRKPPGKSGGDMAGGKAPGNQEFTDPQQRLAAAYAANNP
jgi:hypothetical protein